MRTAAMDGRFWIPTFATGQAQVTEGWNGDPGWIARAVASSAMTVRIERP
jgi:hypothetical protein